MPLRDRGSYPSSTSPYQDALGEIAYVVRRARDHYANHIALTPTVYGYAIAKDAKRNCGGCRAEGLITFFGYRKHLPLDYQDPTWAKPDFGLSSLQHRLDNP